VIRILTEHGGRPPAPLVSLIRTLIAERELDARFLIPIIGELDKAEIIRQIPRVVSMLGGSGKSGPKASEDKALVRSMFFAILEKPEHGFGKISTNLPRVRENQLIEPVKLLVLLHESPDIAVKDAREGIADFPSTFAMC
jgi:symplekin